MPNLVLIDHCLAGVGGHYYQYATDILTAAHECGYRPVLALRREFPSHERFPDTWRVFPLFRFGFKNDHSAGVDGRSRRAIGLDGRWSDAGTTAWPIRLLDAVRYADRRRRLQDFQSACATLFSQIGWHADDIAFLPTMSEFDLLGLVRFLKATPQSSLLAWHIQMHFDIFSGREADHGPQTATRDLIRRQILDAFAQIPAHRLHFYSTTDEMCRQYNRLQVATFQTLPYPVRSKLDRAAETPPPASPRPLRMTLAGAVRREKGKRQLGQLVQSLWDEFLTRGQAQLWVQLNPKGLRRLPQPAAAAARTTSDVGREDVGREQDAPIVAVKHPLPTRDYDELIRRSDVGLFIYESNRYHSRCSGILVEMLSAGVPVIVPAGCWLAEQIADAAYEHLDLLPRQGTVLQRIEIPPGQWQRGGAAASSGHVPERVTCGSRGKPSAVDVPVPSGAVQALISCGWSSENPPGSYLRVATSGPESGPERTAASPSAARVAVVGSRHTPGPIHVLVPLEPAQAVLRLDLQNAYHPLPLYVDSAAVTFLAAPAGQAGYPLSRVGIAVADLGQVPAAVREMLAHRQHYQDSAREFSRLWNEAHAPQRTVEILQARGLT